MGSEACKTGILTHLSQHINLIALAKCFLLLTASLDFALIHTSWHLQVCALPFLPNGLPDHKRIALFVVA